MANRIQPKRNAVQGALPIPNDLIVAELAINTTDKVLYSKDDAGVIFPIGKFSRLKYAGSKNTSYSAAPFELVGVSTSGGVVTVRLPAAPPDGCIVGVYDVGGALATNAARVFSTAYDVAGNGGGLVLDVNGVYIEFVFIDAVVGWRVRSWVIPTILPGTGLVDEGSWTQFETDTWATSAAILGTEPLSWGNV